MSATAQITAAQIKKVLVSISGKLQVNGEDVSPEIQMAFKVCADSLEGFNRGDTRTRFLDQMANIQRGKEAVAILKFLGF